jgi:hypothetical protein
MGNFLTSKAAIAQEPSSNEIFEKDVPAVSRQALPSPQMKVSENNNSNQIHPEESSQIENTYNDLKKEEIQNEVKEIVISSVEEIPSQDINEEKKPKRRRKNRRN